MIYLIDDNSNRQVGYGWTSERFERFKSLIQIIHTYDEVDEVIRKSIFTNGSIILFHESFFDNPINQNLDNSTKIKEDLIQYAERKKDNYTLVLFSGSNGNRYRNDNIIYMPVDIVYNNLETFLQKGIVHNSLDINYLLYGSNPIIESEIIEKLEEFNKREFELPDFDDSDYNNFVALTLESEIPKPFKMSTSESFFEDDISDEYLNNIVVEWFEDDKYDNIFIPLCFGSTLSDFNGLKMAAHIRCTDSINTLQNIFIYGFFDESQLILNKYFDILKTKNVHLINYSKKDFEDALKIDQDYYGLQELPIEIQKLKLNPPKDNHIISNEWAIYRWAETIQALDNDIKKIIREIDSNLYFKYLKTIYPISKPDQLTNSELVINTSTKAKILYVDDEADKGWSEIFCKIILDVNTMDFHYIGDELKSKSKGEIIDLSLSKIIDDEFDIVILDFRLHRNDLGEKVLKKITGFQILEKIKKHNPGIQVIIFSATNKIWNLQALQEAGADGFVIKESPENSIDVNFTKESILNFKEIFEICLDRIFLKEIYKKLIPLITKVNENILKNPRKYDLRIKQGFLQKYYDYLISADLLLNTNYQDLKYSFLQFILIVEDIIKNSYLSDFKNDHYVEIDLLTRQVCLEKKFGDIELVLSPLTKWKKFEVKNCVISDSTIDFNLFSGDSERVPFNYRLNCVLHFKYGIDLQAAADFSELYRIRSSSVAHMGDRKIQKSDLLKVINLLNILLS